jgi:hypothetical protein
MDIRFLISATALPVFHLLDEVPYDAIGNAPLDEVELSDGGRETLKLDAGRSAKRIKEFLGIAVQTRLVGHMDRKHLAIWSCVRHVLVLRIVGHEPLQFTK